MFCKKPNSLKHCVMLGSTIGKGIWFSSYQSHSIKIWITLYLQTPLLVIISKMSKLQFFQPSSLKSKFNLWQRVQMLTTIQKHGKQTIFVIFLTISIPCSVFYLCTKNVALQSFINLGKNPPTFYTLKLVVKVILKMKKNPPYLILCGNSFAFFNLGKKNWYIERIFVEKIILNR